MVNFCVHGLRNIYANQQMRPDPAYARDNVARWQSRETGLRQWFQIFIDKTLNEISISFNVYF